MKNQLYLDAAEKIGNRLCRDAFRANEKCNWYGPSMEWIDNQWKVAYRMGEGELYAGTSGIGLFLSYLFHFTGENLHKATATGAILHALSRTLQLKHSNPYGFYSGSCGVAYAAIRAGENTGQPALIKKGLALLKKIVKQKPDATAQDIVSGSAGLILALSALNRSYPSEDFLLAIGKHADMLVQEGHRSGRGISWSQPGIQQRGDLTGFSHGAAGIATALMEAYLCTGEDIYKSTAEEAFRYEQSWFNAQQGNWPDLRIDMTQPQQQQSQELAYPSQWCHGAAGILLSRAHAWGVTGEEIYRQQAEHAIRSTLHTLQNPQQYGLANFCLCHGQAGNASILLTAAEAFEQPNLYQAAEEKGMEGINWFHKNDIPWPGGIPAHPEEVPGLMMGCAGTGYFLLQLYMPEEIPSILLLTGTEAEKKIKKNPSEMHTEATALTH